MIIKDTLRIRALLKYYNFYHVCSGGHGCNHVYVNVNKNRWYHYNLRSTEEIHTIKDFYLEYNILKKKNGRRRTLYRYSKYCIYN